MKALVAKEIRLMLPAFALALFLIIVPVRLFTQVWTYPLFCFGALMIALSSFGREFVMGTFPTLLALPLTRASIWWIKIAVLVSTLSMTFLVFLISLRWSTVDIGEMQPLAGYGGQAVLATAFVTIFASGLWTTLLLRQMMAAFWIALLVPASILTLILGNHGTVPTAEAVLGLYSVAGFVWAWRQFYRAQEVGWTGGEIDLPEWRSASGTRAATRRTYRPWAAFVGKEFRLYRVALLGMAGLFLLHLAVVVLRNSLHNEIVSPAISSFLAVFGGVWLIVPLLTGSLNVADERRMGILESELCLPISTRKQFGIKLFVVLLISGVLSALLLSLAEGIGGAFSMKDGIERIITLPHSEDMPGSLYAFYLFFVLLPIFLGLTLLIFYASTLTWSILQTIVAAAGIGVGLAVIWTIAAAVARSDYPVLQGELLLAVISVPVMVVAVMALAYCNYRRLCGTRRLWMRNATGLILAMLFAATATSLALNRSWERFIPLEPPHGPAKLTISQAASFKGTMNGFAMILPDGRLGAVLKGNRLLEGSNWVKLAVGNSAIWAIRADGTLWQWGPRAIAVGRTGEKQAVGPMQLAQWGMATDWKSVVVGNQMVILLNKDGTLWDLDHQIGVESDWAEIFSSDSWGLLAWKGDGRASRIFLRSDKPPRQVNGENEYALFRWEGVEHFKWRSLADFAGGSFAVRDDGTLWRIGAGLRRVDNESDWISLAGNYYNLVGLKADGTLWKWDSLGTRNTIYRPPTRLGSKSDWVAVSGYGTVASLAADGSIWYWPQAESGDWLVPSGRPAKIDNIFAPQ